VAALLHAAVRAHNDPDASCIKLLLSRGAQVDSVCRDAEGRERTALMRACICACCVLAVKALLGGANPMYQSLSDELTALHVAAAHGLHAHCEQLLAASHRRAVKVQDVEGKTPLHHAALHDHLEVVELLHQHRADLAAADKEGYEPLHAAAEAGHCSVVQYLLRNGEDVSAAMADYTGETALHRAAQTGKTAVVQLLLESGALAAATSKFGTNALFNAVRHGHLAVMELLLAHGLSADSKAATDPNSEQLSGNRATASPVSDYYALVP
jgi:ankyrin repeat protein